MDNQNPDSEIDSSHAADQTRKTDDQSLIAVGVGASAGGLEAFNELLRHLPANTGMAFVLIQHLDPRHESVLTELLATKTSMPVVQARHEMRIEPDHVYVIPPNTTMRVHDGALTLEARPDLQGAFRPIDTFFHSLAEEFHFNAVGIVLSGTASDGTLGLKAVKAEGGITFAQNQTAKFDSMPRSAMAAGVVDFVLSPRRIAEELVSISRRSTNPEAADALMGDGTTVHRMLLLLRSNTGVDFTQYKQTTILRRLHRRMVLRKIGKPEEYLALLHQDSEEAKALFDDLLINVTDFFRDPDVFEAAKRVAFPSVIRDRKQSELIRVWVPGCSTGEEVYSTAIALIEFLESEDLNFGIQIFGSDVSDSTIEKARNGIFGGSAVANVSPERLRRFFVRTDSGYQISRTIREMCIFSRHNVAHDPPLSKMDLISCRNLLIYLSPSLQKRIIATFGYALQPSGCLILGSSETLGALAEYFLVLDEKHKIFCKKTNVAVNVFQMLDSSGEVPRPAPPQPPASVPDLANLSGPIHRLVDQMVLSRLGPVGFVVNETLKITEYRGEVDKYLITPTQEQGADLMQTLRPDLRAAISTAVEQARRTQVAVLADQWPGSSTEEQQTLAVTVVPISITGIPAHFLILIGRHSEPMGIWSGTVELAPEERSVAPVSLEDENARLKQELKSTREYLQSVIEELRSTNEEAQSANEELQSTNEEMQTSKEELQSSNEELNTITTEMQSRNAELKQVNDDLINLLASMNMPIVMTGNDLRIRRFTPIAEKALRLITTDVGRPIADLKPRINVPDLDDILQRVLDTLQPYEREVHDPEGRSYLMRVRPYRTSDNRIDGTVLQLLDVTELNRSLEEVKHSRDYAEAIVNTVREPLVVLDENNFIRDANRAFYEALDLSPSSAQGKSIFEVARARFDLPQIRALFDTLGQGTTELNDIEMTHRRNDAEIRTLLVNGRRLRFADHRLLVLMAFEDITERKRAAEARYRRLFESARDGIILVDAETGEIFDVNPFAERLFGYRNDELLGRKLWEIEAMQHVPTMRAAVERIRDQGVFRLNDVVLRNKDGRDLQVEVIANQYTEKDRPAIQFNMRDVSERKKFEREIQESQRLESLGLLAGGIAHDFNNLLTGIIGNASLGLSETSSDDPVRVRFREIVNASERASFLTRQMLAYAGRGRFVITTIDLGDLIKEMSALLRTSIPQSVEVELDLAPDLPPIEGDAGQIQQVIMNLIINAAEAIGESKPGKVVVRTSSRELSARDAAAIVERENAGAALYVQLEVIDTGQGMDDATKARIFDPFFTTKFLGRGLGLAAVQGIVKGHGGIISVYSTPGQGTAFVVILPGKGRGARDQKWEAEPRRRSIPPGSVALVIDDEKTIRTLSENVLSRAGMKVLTAENGSIGVEMFRQYNQTLSVVVLDLQMPVMGGEEALKLLRQINPDVAVILSSGFDETEAQRRFSSLKPARFLQKPYTAERLVGAVADTVNHN